MVNRVQGFWVGLLLFCVISSAIAQDWIYTIKPGDTVWDISHTTLKDWRYWKEILQHNDISNAVAIRPGTQIAIPLYIVHEEPAEVHVDAVRGEVKVVFGQHGKKMALKPGMSLATGDKVFTSEKSTAMLSLEDGSSIFLQEKSEIEFIRMRILGGKNSSMDAKMDMHRGSMKMNANPAYIPDSNYEIVTVSANSAVRGTGFRIGVENNSSRTEVLDGRVNVGNAHGDVDVPSGFGTMAIKNQPPLQPKPLLPPPNLEALPALIRYLPVVLRLDSLAGAKSYRIQIARDEAFLEPVLNRVVKAGLLVDQTLSDGSYYIRVRGVDAYGLEGRDATRKFSIEARPEAPLVRAPLPGKVLHAGEMQFSWAEVDAVSEYVFELADDETFTRFLEKKSLPDADLAVTVTQPGNYYFRISSVAADGKQGPPGKPVEIEILPIPAVPEAKPPKMDGDQLHLAWREIDGIASYQVQLATDSDFFELVLDKKTELPQVQLLRPPSGYYYFRLRAIDSEGYAGSFSTPQRFQVEPGSYLPMVIFGMISVLLLL